MNKLRFFVSIHQKQTLAPLTVARRSLCDNCSAQTHLDGVDKVVVLPIREIREGIVEVFLGFGSFSVNGDTTLGLELVLSNVVPAEQTEGDDLHSVEALEGVGNVLVLV